MTSLVLLMPLLPLVMAILLGVFALTNWQLSARGEKFIAYSSALTSTIVLLVGIWLWCTTDSDNLISLGSWLTSEVLDISLSFFTAGFNMAFALFFTLQLLVLQRFAVRYLHQEAGFLRFFGALNLSIAALMLLLLSASSIGTFIGWQLVNLCTYLMVAYAFSKHVPAFNATRVFISNLIGDACFLLAIGLGFSWTGTVNWLDLKSTLPDLEAGEITLLALCFASAAFIKAALFPFTPWLTRAMEGPVVANATITLLAHSGVFLVLLLQPLFERSLIAMTVLVVFGLITTIYCYFVGLTQTDIKSSLSFAISGQLGLMLAACGLGLWDYVVWYLVIHSVVRCYQFLNAPGFLHNTRDVPLWPVLQLLGNRSWAYVASLQRLWLDPLTDWTIVYPTLGLAKDLSYFDDHVIDASMGVPAPAINALASLAQLEEQRIGAHLDEDSDKFARGSGLAGKLANGTAAILHWVEDRLIIRGINEDAMSFGRQLGHIANRIEQLLLRPRYLSLFVFITLLVAF